MLAGPPALRGRIDLQDRASARHDARAPAAGVVADQAVVRARGALGDAVERGRARRPEAHGTIRVRGPLHLPRSLASRHGVAALDGIRAVFAFEALRRAYVLAAPRLEWTRRPGAAIGASSTAASASTASASTAPASTAPAPAAAPASTAAASAAAAPATATPARSAAAGAAVAGVAVGSERAAAACKRHQSQR